MSLEAKRAILLQILSTVNLQKIFFPILSFLIVALAQPDLSPFACILASAFGYALFWKALSLFSSTKIRFLFSLLWFGSIQIIHLSWFTADHYVGAPIYFFLALLFLILGTLFGLFSLLVKQGGGFLNFLALASAWTLLEWSRLFVMSGFSWNPVGLALSGTSIGMQMAGCLGVFGLSFMVILTNLLAFKALFYPRYFSFWLLLALLPYGYGFLHLSFHQKRVEKAPSLSALLVQTSISPEEKLETYSPLEQWRKILQLLEEHRLKKVDLILLPEAGVPYGTDLPLYSEAALQGAFNPPFTHTLKNDSGELWGNASFAESLAKAFNADVVMGLEDIEWGANETKVYNSAFFFHPDAQKRERYVKRVLVPLGEYIPFRWCKKFLSKYGIKDSFVKGVEALVVKGKKAKFGLSICYEETFGHLMRENRIKGSEVLLNLTNDVWYPQSRLPMVHLMHGRLRSVEMGIPMLRACNTGVTCGIDSLGRMVATLPWDKRGFQSQAGALFLTLPLYSYPTLYTLVGDKGILGCCVLSLLFFSISLRRAKTRSGVI